MHLMHANHDCHFWLQSLENGFSCLTGTLHYTFLGPDPKIATWQLSLGPQLMKCMATGTRVHPTHISEDLLPCVHAGGQTSAAEGSAASRASMMEVTNPSRPGLSG